MSGSTGTSPVITTLAVDDAEFRSSLQAASQLLNGYVRTNETAARAIAAANRQTDLATRSIGDSARATDQAAGGVRNYGNVMQQAGFQIGDFAGQVQAGTSWMTALSQQGSQMLGVFGTGGAIAGAALTVGLLATSLMNGADNAEALRKNGEAAFKGMADAAKSVRDTTQQIADLFLTVEQRALAAANSQIELLRETARNNLSVTNQRMDDAASARVEALSELRKIAEAEAKVMENIARVRRSGATLSPQDESDLLRPFVTRRFAANSMLQGADAVIGRMSTRTGEINDQLSRLQTLTPAMIVANGRSGGAGGGRAGRTEIDAAVRDADRLQNAFDAFFDKAEEAGERRASRFEDTVQRTGRAVDDLGNLGREFGTVFNSAFDGLISKGGNFAEVLDRLSTGVARIIERQLITKPLESALSSLFEGQTLSGMASGAGNWLMSNLGFRAAGGPVGAGMPYIVGEAGPELFIPDHSGSIVPNHALGGGGVSIMVDARGADTGVEARIDAVLARRMPAIVAASRASLTASVARGGDDARAFGRRR